MNYYQESMCLSLEEIMAVLSVAGKKVVSGFRQEEIDRCTPERLLEACCRMMGDKLLTVIDGKFRLCRELAAVLQPICTAKRVLAVTGGEDNSLCVTYYLSDGITAMERKAAGGFALTRVVPEGLPGDLEERLQLTLRDREQTAFQPGSDISWDAPHAVLASGSQCLLECLDADTAERMAWLRLSQEELRMAIGENVTCAAINRRTWQEMLDKTVKGEFQT